METTYAELTAKIRDLEAKNRQLKQEISQFAQDMKTLRRQLRASQAREPKPRQGSRPLRTHKLGATRQRAQESHQGAS